MPKAKKAAPKKAAPATKPAAAPALAPKPTGPRPTTIVMVDDDIFMAGIYGTRLTSEGFRVVNAYDGVEGLERIAKEKPDLILLDVLMPKLDGFEVLTRLKADTELAKIPVIMLTSMGQKEDVDRGLQGGAVDYLLKTQTLPTDALDKIRKVLGKK